MDGRELKNYQRMRDEARPLRARNAHLELELLACRPALYRADQKIDRLEQRNARLDKENRMLKKRVAELTEKLKHKPAQDGQSQSPPLLPPFKPNMPATKRRRKPGRKPGHPAALRPIPEKIDVRQDVPLPIDNAGKVSCPECGTQLNNVKHHKRIVEDIIPAKIATTCYNTVSGDCPCCRKHVESRSPDQPPAHDLPHAQLGLNTLATAAVMRVCYRLPLRQITRLFAQLPGLKLSPGAIVKQLKRLAGWLEKQYERLKLALCVSGVVYGDETGWRIDGKNGYLWTLTNEDQTLYHIDRSRGGKVIAGLLGETFGKDAKNDQTLVSDFYAVYDQFQGPLQKCLAHVLRELKDTVAKRPELKGHQFFKRCKRLVQEMLKLKKQRKKLGRKVYARCVERLEARLEALGELRCGDKDAHRLAARLKKHRANLTTFLHKKDVDGTNNAAERALRPAVVMRKITGGSRSEAGAKAWAILASVMRTAEQRGRDVVETIKTLLRAEWGGVEVPFVPLSAGTS